MSCCVGGRRVVEDACVAEMEPVAPARGSIFVIGDLADGGDEVVSRERRQATLAMPSVSTPW